ncbi:MAG: GTPase ObgE [Candidatus Taylorbacteria bacterium CG11_big_fil_rev_8_21_14_0_20_46_11]|uniref:GTPase Obg n=1 Tax=Candidatus Taylorbacteria bacterium CG11_big_fil_rev_8_21_14_0_20_46_11 TaxID=1975025 RepID=A0A2H0KA46_9BACT|nr:MAG: GTPase ObgE [Candidatus Taylorbacteria bacterium CG11_big_fil_rev_8_21_14_0_20_46_11]
MAFVDEVILHLKAGDGGNGVISWLHEKGKEYMGPAGGDGGKGGDMYFTAVRNVARLASYRYGNLFVADNGGSGQRKSMHGKNGKDRELEVPIGSIITNKKTGRTYELLTEGEKVKVLHGGKGGLGNEHFKGSTNIRPDQCTPGKAGDEADFHVELRLFADAGLIGLPNAGKSSLLNEITRANVKVAGYAFTTLEPNLGALHGYVIADIPGLIEGASEGKGLGIKFLKHITRTKLLLHCISLEQEDVLKTYKVVRRELEAFSPELAKKKEVVILTKTDIVDSATIKKAVTLFKKEKMNALAVSAIDDKCIKAFKESLVDILAKG